MAWPFGRWHPRKQGGRDTDNNQPQLPSPSTMLPPTGGGKKWLSGPYDALSCICVGPSQTSSQQQHQQHHLPGAATGATAYGRRGGGTGAPPDPPASSPCAWGGAAPRARAVPALHALLLCCPQGCGHGAHGGRACPCLCPHCLHHCRHLRPHGPGLLDPRGRVRHLLSPHCCPALGASCWTAGVRMTGPELLLHSCPACEWVGTGASAECSLSPDHPCRSPAPPATMTICTGPRRLHFLPPPCPVVLCASHPCMHAAPVSAPIQPTPTPNDGRAMLCRRVHTRCSPSFSNKITPSDTSARCDSVRSVL